MKPKKGMIFEHSRFLSPDTNGPLKCKVTKLGMGGVYYRPYYGLHDDGSEWLGSPYWIAADKFYLSVRSPEGKGAGYESRGPLSALPNGDSGPPASTVQS